MMDLRKNIKNYYEAVEYYKAALEEVRKLREELNKKYKFLLSLLKLVETNPTEYTELLARCMVIRPQLDELAKNINKLEGDIISELTNLSVEGLEID